MGHTEGKIITLRKLGVPYPADFEYEAVDKAKAQAQTVAKDLTDNGIVNVKPQKEIVALIAYLQRLGTDLKKPVPDSTKTTAAK
jgi:cytochrome c oxidase cbb3-type subunit I/II